MSHHRVAAGYLRTGNIDLVRVEIDGLREAWAKVSTLPRPAAFRDQERYTGMVLQVAAQLVGISLVLNLGRPDVARESLDKIRRMVSDLRRENGVTVLADCVLDANVANGCPDRDRSRSPTGRAPPPAVSPTPQRSGAATAWRRAASAITPSFAAWSTARSRASRSFPRRSKRATPTCLHRLMIELRSFDNLLAFRFG